MKLLSGFNPMSEPVGLYTSLPNHSITPDQIYSECSVFTKHSCGVSVNEKWSLHCTWQTVQAKWCNYGIYCLYVGIYGKVMQKPKTHNVVICSLSISENEKCRIHG